MANNQKNSGLFSQLTDLFRSGPVIRRKVKKFQGKSSNSKSSLEIFRKAHSDIYNSTLSAYGSYDRMARYSDFSEMEATPEISSALDIYSEECVSPDVEGNVLHIYSDNHMIKQLLTELFYDILNIDFNLVMWVRNLCKYGDFFLFNDIHPEYGVINVYPIPISEIEREEGFDPDDPGAVRFRWITQGNRVLENWQVSHFRLLGNDAFLPYGSSVLEGARRIWRQLILIEDAMLVYRVIRSPERRVFYIDVGNIPPENVADYLEQAQTSLKRNAVIDKTTGQVDLRYNPLSVDEDYFLPVRGGESGTRIDTLAGGSNTTAIEDVEYIQKKLFAALKIPKAYLGYDEDIGAKATLAQEDVRFSRTIQRIQKTIVAELNKIAMIHLYTHGYTEESLLDFDIKLSNPSSIAQQQKLELIRSKFEIAGQAPEGMVDRAWIRAHILDLNPDEIESIERGKIKDKITDMKLEAVQLPQDDAMTFGDENQAASDVGGDAGSLFGDSGGAGEKEGMSGEEDSGGGLGGLFAGEKKNGNLMSEEDFAELDSLIEEDDLPIKASMTKRPKKYRKSSIINVDDGIDDMTTGTGALVPDKGISIKDLASLGSIENLNDNIMPQSKVINDYIDKKMSYRFNKTLDNMSKSLGISNKKHLIKENNDEEYNILIEDDLFSEGDDS